MRWLLLLAVLACTARPRAEEEPEAGAGPRLVVLIVVDQLPSWAFAERMPLYQHGLARLLREGLTFPNAAYPFASTFTSAGHAAIVTGAPPSESGIVANKWWDRETGRVIESVEDAEHPVHAVGGGVAPRGVSPRRLRLETVGDSLRRAYPRARVVSVSFKDRSAVLLGGQRADLALWYDPRQTAFTTSHFYARRAPAWLANLARRQGIATRVKSYVWQPLDAEALARATGIPDEGPGEADTYQMGIVFPHRLAAAKKPAEDVEATPLSNDIVLEAVQAALVEEELGQDAAPDLLLISFSAHDLIAHVYGQESWEALDELLRLDRQIGQLLDLFDERVGPGRWALVFTSDHGAARTIEQSRARGRLAVRVNPATLEGLAEKAAAAVAGPGDWISYGRDPTLYLSEAGRALPDDARGAVLDAVVSTVAAIDGVGYARRSDQLAGDCDARPELDALMCRSIDAERSGEIFFGPRNDSVIMMPPDEATSHGSASPDDRTVPVIVLDPNRSPGLADGPVSVLRVASTLAKLLGVPPPPAARDAPL